MKPKTFDKKPGIYVIRNLINQKIYVGKSKNIYKRLHQHLTDIKIENRRKNENRYLLNSVLKHGIENFDYYVIEYTLEDEKTLSERELYWMKQLDSLNREKGYNLRWDSETKCYCSEETKKKISDRIKNEFKTGVRTVEKVSKQMKEEWKDNDERKKNQSNLMSKLKTKYKYQLYKEDEFIEECNFERLKELGLSTVLSNFHRRKSDDVKCKGYRIVRIAEDIVNQ